MGIPDGNSTEHNGQSFCFLICKENTVAFRPFFRKLSLGLETLRPKSAESIKKEERLWNEKKKWGTKVKEEKAEIIIRLGLKGKRDVDSTSAPFPLNYLSFSLSLSLSFSRSWPEWPRVTA